MIRPHPIVRQIIDRDCHVSMSDRDVVRHVIGKLKHGYETLHGLSPPEREEFLAGCLWTHEENRALYGDVMTGQLSRPARKRSLSEVPPPSLTGPEIVRLMRKHKQTIKALSGKMGITQKRIRTVRARGLADPLAVRDWLQAITDVDPGPIPQSVRVEASQLSLECGFCGCPLHPGEVAYKYVSELFCSTACCRFSRGWR